MTGKVIATSGNIGGLEIKNTTLSDLNKTANDAKSEAETANTNITNITNGTTAIPHVKSTAIEINGKNMTIGAEGKLTLQSNAGIVVQSGGSININSGGKFTIDSTNFKIDSSGNVILTGKITATDGKIGGWTIGTDKLYSGSGASYVALDTNASYPAIWAGNETYNNAPFRVDKDGSVYITSLYVQNEAGTSTTKVNLLQSYWKMYTAYDRAVKSMNVVNDTLTIALFDGTTVNFKKADGLTIGTAGAKMVYIADSNNTIVGDTKYVGFKEGAAITSIDTSTKIATCSIGLYLGTTSTSIGDYTAVKIDASVAYNAVTIDKVEKTDLSYDTENATYNMTVEATISNGKTKKAGIPFVATEAYIDGRDYANSLYSAVNVTPISTAHRVNYVSFKRQGTGKSPTPKVLYNNAGQAVTVYDVGSANTVYTAGTTVEYYTVSSFTGTVLYEAGTQKTYYTKST